jgi:hypothetical protein
MAQHMTCTQGVPGSIPEGYNLSLLIYLYSDIYTNKKQQLLTNGWEERMRKISALKTFSVAKIIECWWWKNEI